MADATAGPRRYIKGAQERNPGLRACCMICDFKGGILDNFLDDTPATYRHIYGSGGGGLSALFPRDRVGIMYTCAGGFIDFGHMRDLADLTFYYFQAMRRGCRSKGDVIPRPPGIRGEVTIEDDIPANLAIDIARDAAYQESIYHEIETYWDHSVGAHHSSFSPEDLVSNYLGTYVAKQAISGGPDFNSAMGTAIKNVMFVMGVLPRAGTQAAYDVIKPYWVRSVANRAPALPDNYLRRRNFAVWPVRPWLVNNLSNCVGAAGVFPSVNPAWPIDPAAVDYYQAVYEVPAASRGPGKIASETVTPDDFPTLIDAIKSDARQVYGENYDSPDPVGRLGP
jgi:hypothetical protein